MIDYELLYEKCLELRNKHWKNVDLFYVSFYKKNSNELDCVYIPLGFDKNVYLNALKAVVNDDCFEKFEVEELNNYYKLLKFMDENE